MQELSIGMYHSSENIELKNVSGQENTNKILSQLDLKEHNIIGLFYSLEDINDESQATLNEYFSFLPVYPLEKLNLSIEQFNQLTFAELFKQTQKINQSWVLKNNLSSISEMISFKEHLENLLEKDRIAFFEEMWFFLKRNMAPQSLSVLYHGLKKTNENTDKYSLVNMKVTGNIKPETQNCSEFENNIFEVYNTEINSSFSLHEFNQEKGEIVLSFKINTGPVIVMAKVLDFTPLQNALFSGIFNQL